MPIEAKTCIHEKLYCFKPPLKYVQVKGSTAQLALSKSAGVTLRDVSPGVITAFS